jgi:putative transposase
MLGTLELEQLYVRIRASKKTVLAYFSRKLHRAETRYSTYDKELLAIQDALKHWHYYLVGRHTTVSTDHTSLRHVLSQPKLSQRQIRALEDMLEYDCDIDYLPGVKNYVQDALNRRPIITNHRFCEPGLHLEK